LVPVYLPFAIMVRVQYSYSGRSSSWPHIIFLIDVCTMVRRSIGSTYEREYMYMYSKQLLSRGLAGGAREEARKQASKGGSEEASMARQGGGTITSNSILE